LLRSVRVKEDISVGRGGRQLVGPSEARRQAILRTVAFVLWLRCLGYRMSGSERQTPKRQEAVLQRGIRNFSRDRTLMNIESKLLA
jgi:hypothetical protein